MRRFLHDYESVITMEELQNGEEFKEFMEENPDESFARYLDLCMYWNNGFLTEILTADTPVENRRGAVMLCAVFDGEYDYADMPWVAYLNAAEIAQQKRCGKVVTAYIGKWC